MKAPSASRIGVFSIGWKWLALTPAHRVPIALHDEDVKLRQQTVSKAPDVAIGALNLGPVVVLADKSGDGSKKVALPPGRRLQGMAGGARRKLLAWSVRASRSGGGSPTA